MGSSWGTEESINNVQTATLVSLYLRTTNILPLCLYSLLVQNSDKCMVKSFCFCMIIRYHLPPIKDQKGSDSGWLIVVFAL